MCKASALCTCDYINTVNIWYLHNSLLLKTTTSESPSFHHYFWEKKLEINLLSYRFQGSRLFQSEITEVKPEDKHKDLSKRTLPWLSLATGHPKNMRCYRVTWIIYWVPHLSLQPVLGFLRTGAPKSDAKMSNTNTVQRQKPLQLPKHDLWTTDLVLQKTMKLKRNKLYTTSGKKKNPHH